MNHHGSVYSEASVGGNLEVVRRRWRLLIIFVIVGLFSAGVYLSLVPPQFTSTSLLMIDPRVSPTFSGQVGTTDSTMASARVESQVEIIRSEQVAQTVVEKLDLEDALLQPGPVRRLCQQGIAALGLARLCAPALIRERHTAASAALANHLSVRRLGATYAIEISATMPSAEQAAAVVNTVGDTYMELQRQLGVEGAHRAAQMLETSTAQLRAQARNAEKAVEELKLSGTLNVADPTASKGKLRDLESAAFAYRNLYNRVLERSIETSQQQLASLPDAQIVSPGRAPYRKSGPKSLLIIAACLAFGLSIGTAVALYKG